MYNVRMNSLSHTMLDRPSFYATSFALRRFDFGGYGFGHTSMREPGDLRGTVVGRKGRYRTSVELSGGDV